MATAMTMATAGPIRREHSPDDGIAALHEATNMLHWAMGNNKTCRRTAGDFDCHTYGCGGISQVASPVRARPWLHSEPLDATIRQVPALYCPGSRHGQQIC